MRWILGIIGALAVVLLAAIGVYVLIPAERIAAVASHEFERATGRSVTFTGGIRPVAWPPGIRTGPFEIANAGWSAEGPMVSADGMRIGIRLDALATGNVRIDTIQVERPRLLLERDARGRVNWRADGKEPAPSVAGTGFPAARIALREGTVTLIDRGAATRRTVEGLSLDLALAGAGEPARLAASGRVDGVPVGLALSVADLEGFRRGEVTGAGVEFRSPGFTLEFEGRAAARPFAAEGRLDLALADAGRLAPRFGRPAPPPGAPAPRPVPLTLAGAATWTAERSFHLREAGMTLGASRIEGALDVATGGRPRIEAELVSPLIDLTPLFPPRPGPGVDAWPGAPIEHAWLAPVDARIALLADRMVLRGMEAGPVRLLLTLDEGRATADLHEFKAYGGEATGQLVLNGRSGLSAGGDLRVDAMELRPLLSAAGVTGGVSGTLDGRLRFLALGETVAAMMNSLSGEGGIELRDGAVGGLDLPGALRGAPVLARRAMTGFDTASGSFRIAGGTLANDDFVMTSPVLTAHGSGTIGIGSRTFNYRLEPEPSTSERGGRMRVPVLITGTWGAPQIRLGVRSAADEAVAAERARIETATTPPDEPVGAPGGR